MECVRRPSQLFSKFWFVRASNEPCVTKNIEMVRREFTLRLAIFHILCYIRRMPRLSSKEAPELARKNASNVRAKSQLYHN